MRCGLDVTNWIEDCAAQMQIRSLLDMLIGFGGLLLFWPVAAVEILYIVSNYGHG